MRQSKRAAASAILSLMTGHAALAQDLSRKDADAGNISLYTEEYLHELDKTLAYKGWNIPAPSFADTVTQDDGGMRSTLAKYGIGFIDVNISGFGDNLLNYPTSGVGPRNLPSGTSDQQYWGQRPSLANYSEFQFTYDLTQYGIPDGQFQFGASISGSTWEHALADRVDFKGVSWYQTLFNKAVELHFGYFQLGNEFVGIFVGGNYANTLGPSSFIPQELGMTLAPANSPAVRVTWNITDVVYEEFAIARSLGICLKPGTNKTCTGDVFYDDAYNNPTATRFSVPNGDALYIDEVGYKQEAAPGVLKTWFRVGGEYNSSEFNNFSLATPRNVFTPGIEQGSFAIWALADRQLWQTEPDSAKTAYKGIYGGVTYEYAPPQSNTYSQYYEGRFYGIGIFLSRPTDLTSIVYSHNDFSKIIADDTNEAAALLHSGLYAQRFNNALTVSHLFHVMPGVWWGVGASYTDHPSFTYTAPEGHDFAVVSSLTTNF